LFFYKAATLSIRASAKGASAKEASAKAPKEKKAKSSNDVADATIMSLQISGPTSEANPRVQVCGRADGHTRIFLCTFLTKFHRNWADILQAIKAKVSAGGCKKADILALRDSMKTT
jgi:hypothetical protein